MIRPIVAAMLLALTMATTAAARDDCFHPDGYLSHGSMVADQRPVASLAIAQDLAFVLRRPDAGQPPELQIYDFTDPGSLVLLGALDLPDTDLAKLVVQGDRVYLITDEDVEPGLLLTVDAADPAAPALLSTMPVEQGIIDLDARDSLVALTSPYYGLILVDATDGAVPQWLSFFWVTGNAQKVELAADFAVCTTTYSFSLLVVDISDPTVPANYYAQVGPRLADLAMDPDGLHGWGTAIVGGLVWIDMALPDRGVVTVDRAGGGALVRDGDRLITHGSGFRCHVVTGAGEVSLRLVDDENLTLLAASGDRLLGYGVGGLQSYTLALHTTSPVIAVEAVQPVEHGELLVPVAGRDLMLELDPYRHRVQLLDPGDPPHIARRGAWGHGGDLRAAVALGDLALVAHEDGVELLDIADPDQIVDLGTVLPHDDVASFLWEGDRLWVGSLYSDLWLYDLSDPTAPVELMHQNWVGSIRAIARYGDSLALGSNNPRYVHVMAPPCLAVLAVDDAAPTAPTALGLAAAPNPFNPATMLRVELPAAGNVAVTIHDLRGRRVRALMTDGNHPAGTLTVPWDGRDDRGRALPAGVYLARAVTDAGAVAVKLALVK